MGIVQDKYPFRWRWAGSRHVPRNFRRRGPAPNSLFVSSFPVSLGCGTAEQREGNYSERCDHVIALGMRRGYPHCRFQPVHICAGRDPPDHPYLVMGKLLHWNKGKKPCSNHHLKGFCFNSWLVFVESFLSVHVRLIVESFLWV